MYVGIENRCPSFLKKSFLKEKSAILTYYSLKMKG
jgi:hypothetical protein